MELNGGRDESVVQATALVRTTLDTMLLSSMLAPAFRDAGPVGSLEAQRFAADLAQSLEAGP